MGAANVDFNIKQGETFERILTLSDATPAPMDLTGYTFRSNVRAKSNGPVVASLAFEVLTQSGGTLGQVKMGMSAAITQALPVKAIAPDPGETSSQYFARKTRFVYDVEMLEPGPSGKTYAILEGFIDAEVNVTYV